VSGGRYLAALAACALWVGGCNHHKEPVAGGAHAVLHAQPGATIVAVDGANVPSGDTINSSGQTVRVTPGLRKVDVHTVSDTGTGAWSVPLRVRSGNAYRLSAGSKTAVSLRIVNDTTGKVLMGGGAGGNAASAATFPSASAPPKPRSPGR
jgi:hypothetical protein